MSAAEVLFIAGTVPFLLLGTVHLAWTLGDLRSPTHFRPTEDAVIAAMKNTQVAAFAGGPGVRTFWASWLGFNLSHAVGVLLVGLVPLAFVVQDYGLVDAVEVIRPLTLVVPLVYLVLAWRFWFVAPAAGATVAFTLFAGSALL